MTAPRRFHYSAEVTFHVDGDSARRAAVSALRDAVREHSEQVAIDASVVLDLDAASIAVDLTDTEDGIRWHRLNHLADALEAQTMRPTFPDTIPLRWSKAR